MRANDVEFSDCFRPSRRYERYIQIFEESKTKKTTSDYNMTPGNITRRDHSICKKARKSKSFPLGID